MFNPLIIIALVIQSAVAKSSRKAGAVLGFIITTGIFFWGLSLYADGDQIAFFGIALSQPVFIIACLVWYGFDTKEFMAAQGEDVAIEQVLKSPLVRERRVVRFYQATLDAWSAGKLSKLNKSFVNEGKLQLESLIKKYPPYKGSALAVFLENFQPLPGEFLVGVGNLQTGNDVGWFTLTNFRLVQKDGRDNTFKEVVLAEIDDFELKGTTTKSLNFELKSGEKIVFEKVLMHPTDKFLDFLIGQPAEQMLDGKQIQELKQSDGEYFPNQEHHLPLVEDMPARSLPIPPALLVRIGMFFLAALVSTVITVTLRDIRLNHLGVVFYVEAGVVGLIIFEILFRTRQWLSIKTLIIYVIIAISLSSWLYALFYGVVSGDYKYALSLAPITSLFSPGVYPYILYSFLDTAITTGIAYWLIRRYKT